MDANRKLNISGGAYMNSCKELQDLRPATTGNNKRNFCKSKIVRPSTSKPSKLNLLKKGRTKVLSQEEYFELQHSEKKRKRGRKSTIPNQVAKFDPVSQKFTIKSGNKITVVEKVGNGVNIYEDDQVMGHQMEAEIPPERLGTFKTEKVEKKDK